MRKQTAAAFGKKVYLLGADAQGAYYWLEQARFDCGWYWGLGYVETYTNNKRPSQARDIASHQHFDSLFLRGAKNGFDMVKDMLVDRTTTEKELWLLLEYMQALYTARHYADMLHIGGAHYTTNPCAEDIKNDAEYTRINQTVIPMLLQRVYALLTPEGGDK